MKVCVIGAGMSGLITTKELIDENHQVICYEKSNSLGGVFSLHDNEKSPSYKSVLLTVSNYAMAFSCFPPKEHEERRFWTVNEYNQYLEDFTEFYHLRPYISFGAEVVSIERWKRSLWRVRVLINGVEDIEIFDAIAVCSGTFSEPKYPELPFVDRSTSPIEIVHSVDYSTPNPYFGKKVLCLGIGESGADIAHEISAVADKAMLSVRRSPPPLIPRYDCEHIGPIPVDGETSKYRYGAFINQYNSAYNLTRNSADWQKAAEETLEQLDQQGMDFDDQSMSNEEKIERFIATWSSRSYAGGRPFLSRFLIKNSIFVKDVVEGRLDVSFSEIDKIEGNTVCFKDGRLFEADVIVCNTGYLAPKTSWFENDSELISFFGQRFNSRTWFKHMIHPKVGNTLAFIGFARPTQGMLPACSELQARYFALLCSNRLKLPPDLQDLTQQENQLEGDMLKGDSTSSLVHYPYYAEGMAELIGCKPSIKTQLFDPYLAYKLYFGSMVPNRYRLDGPHRSPVKAKQIIKKLRVADSPFGQLSTVLLNGRIIYEAVALFSALKRKLWFWLGVGAPDRKVDRAFHAWGPQQLHQNGDKKHHS